MLTSIIGRAEHRARVCVLLAIAASWACSRAPAQDGRRNQNQPERPAPVPTQPAPAPRTAPPVPAAPPTRSVEITEFDCSKQEDSGADRQPQASQLLSQWRAGGPSGASWNASDLKCYASVRAACASGRLRAQLLIGQREATERTLVITASGPQRVEFDVSERSWRLGLDPVRKPALPYRTALFTLRVEVTCQEPEAFSPAGDRYVDVADVRSFVAGFASGE
jgi:hypothetical protein